MSLAPEISRQISVIKIGGGIAAYPRGMARVGAAVAQTARAHRIVVVPGGGPFADAVREFDRRVGLSPDAAHWMAILAMDQYAHALVGHIPGALLVDEPGAIAAAAEVGRAAVLAPSRWMRSADVLPHTWQVTSDSIAAFIAGALDASRLVLVKPTGVGEVVDSYFSSALPRGLPYAVIGYDRIEQLSRTLTG